MVFVWDENKNRINRRKHGVSFETGLGSLKIPTWFQYPDRVVGDEERWHTIGCVGGILILLVVHTNEEEHGEENMRIISARKASRRERALYETHH